MLYSSLEGVATFFPFGLIAEWKLERLFLFPSCLLPSDFSKVDVTPLEGYVTLYVDTKLCLL